ncbi:hypothetical protein JXJ21_24510 [candidate division KSB1 bacterium]|nr:hypothetical protein [candidate division KSB1 bacterium]
MAVEKEKGSIIYKIIILVLIVVLIAAIMIPKQMWDQEARNMQTCRQRMSSLLTAELLYHRFHEATYTDTLDTLIAFFEKNVDKYQLDFVANDTFLNVLIYKFFENDSLVKATIDTVRADTTLKDLRKAVEIQVNLAHSIVRALRDGDSTMAIIIADAQKGILEPHKALKTSYDKVAQLFSGVDIYKTLLNDDSLNVFIKNFTPELSMVHYLPKIKTHEKYKARVDSLFLDHINQLHSCPTTGKKYKIAIVGSTITYPNIYCPLDKDDSLEVVNDWYKTKIGGLRITNHGNIVELEKSWEKPGQ